MRILLIFSLLLSACHASKIYEMPSNDIVKLTKYPATPSDRAWSVLKPLHQADGLRPCCAFGHDLHVELLGIPVPFYKIDNIVEADNLGDHSYNDSFLKSVAMIFSLSNEKVGIIYTKQGGFIDISHVRDTIDNTLFLFSQIYPVIGQHAVIDLGNNELMDRKIQLFAYPHPLSDIERYNIAAFLSAKIAYQMAVWHEIAQWYGYRSFFLVSEEISAFSPEDLYSNLLGSRIALDVILHGYAGQHDQFNQVVTHVLPEVLNQLGAVDYKQTEQAFAYVEGVWWDSSKRVPEKFLVLYRDYSTEHYMIPNQIIGSDEPVKALAIADSFDKYNLADFGELEFWPVKGEVLLDIPKTYLTDLDFKQLADHAKQVDEQILQQK